MEKIIIDTEIFKMYPELNLGIVLCQGVNNKNDKKSKEYLFDTIEDIKKELSQLDNLSELSIIKQWRNAYKKFNEKKNRSSVEALLRRIYNDKEIMTINPLVDIYNGISIRYKIPCGGEDIDQIEKDLQLTFANGTEKFFPISEKIEQNPNKGEVVYKSNDFVICRCFNWREADKSKLTEKTHNAIMCMECLEKSELEKMKNAMKEMKELISLHLGGLCKSFILNKENSSISISIKK